MGSMGIKNAIASDKKCECYAMTEGLAMKESMECLNESSSQSSSLHLKNRRRSASLRQKYQIHGIFLAHLS